MARPYVNLKSENILDELMQVLSSNIARYSALKGVVGITLNGGLSRGYADKLSEIDLVIYLDKEHYENWHKEKAPVALGIVKLDGYLYDIKLADYDDESEKQWDSVALWDLSYAHILFDPLGKIKKLMENKLSVPEISRAEGLMFSSWWYFKLAGDIWISRGDALQGHFIMNRAIIPLLEALFIANEEYIPHEKWIIHMSRSLKWKPEQWEERLAGFLSGGDLSIPALAARQKIMEGLWKDVDTYLIRKSCTGLQLNFSQRGCYELVKYLVDKGRVTIAEWEEKSSIAALNYEPFYSFASIRDGWVIADEEKLADVRPEDMYSWMYEVLCAARPD